MSILYGDEMQEVQRSLLHEVRRNYNSTDRIDITVLKMKETEVQTDAALFEGIYVP